METSLAKNKRAKAPLEAVVQKEVSEWLRLNGYFFWRSNNVPVFGHSGANNAGTMRFRSLPKDTPKGLPDLMVVHLGQFIGIEVKREGMKLRPDQEAFGSKVLLNDGLYFCIHSVAELQAAFEMSGIWKNQ